MHAADRLPQLMPGRNGGQGSPGVGQPVGGVAGLPDRVVENGTATRVVRVFLVFILPTERVWWGQVPASNPQFLTGQGLLRAPPVPHLPVSIQTMVAQHSQQWPGHPPSVVPDMASFCRKSR